MTEWGSRCVGNDGAGRGNSRNNSRQDRLCNRLRDGDALDFRDGEGAAMESLVRRLFAAVF